MSPSHAREWASKRADEPEGDLALELGDVLFVLIAIANEQNIDVAKRPVAAPDLASR